jgi:hypothetical protein
MTAVPLTAATQASADRRFKEPLHGSERAYAWQCPPAAVAAQTTLASTWRKLAVGRANASLNAPTDLYFPDELHRQSSEFTQALTLFIFL